jgi:hypothetical protein
MYGKREGFADIFGGVTQSSKIRLSKILGDVEHHVCSTVKNREILVFGYTHHPLARAQPSYKYKFKYEALKILSSRTVKG